MTEADCARPAVAHLQFKHDDAPGDENIPGVQPTHTIAPVVGWWVPPSHDTHDVDPLAFACVPIAHAKHREAPVPGA